MENSILSINTNATLDSIIEDKNNGINKKFLLNYDSKNKKVLTLYNKIFETNKNTFFKVKFSSGRRDKRLELVSKLNKTITLYKVSNLKQLDKNAFELDKIITIAKERYKVLSIDIKGKIALEEIPDDKIILSIKNNISNSIDYMQY